MNIVEKLKSKWQIQSNWDFTAIMLVYSLAGLGVSFSRRGIFSFFGLNQAPLATKILLSLLLIVPLYQLSTLFFGFLLGQFQFFWSRQKAIGRALGKLPLKLSKIILAPRNS